MRLDLIEIETKHKNSNIILLIILVTFFIVFFSIMGMHFAKLYKAKLILSKKSNESKLNVQNNSTIGVEVEKDNNTNTVENKKDNKNTDMLLPVYSENARNQMKNIYKGNSKIAYLTFDDGPSQAVTPLILDY